MKLSPSVLMHLNSLKSGLQFSLGDTCGRQLHRWAIFASFVSRAPGRRESIASGFIWYRNRLGLDDTAAPFSDEQYRHHEPVLVADFSEAVHGSLGAAAAASIRRGRSRIGVSS
jgi:hypothetical protein